jgi:Tfp pilus assembly protein PilF
MSSARRSILVALALAFAVTSGGGCGGRAVAGRGAASEPRLPAVKVDALREYDAGMRALRLGGPEAHERARPRLQAALAADGTLWEAAHNLGVIAFADGDDDAAVAAFDRALRIHPTHTPSLLARAEAHRRAAAPGKARADYDSALARDPQDVKTHVRLASLLREQGDLDGALDAVRDALRYASTPAVLVELGLIYLAQGRDELAMLVLDKALRIDAKLPAAWNALALVSLSHSKDQEAFERFDRATGLDPSFAAARFNKAAVLLDAGDYSGAATELTPVVRADPEDWDAQVALGVALRGQGKHDEARAMWERVAQGASSGAAGRRVRADALFNLAVLEMDFRRSEDGARAALDRYLQKSSPTHWKRKEAQQRRQELGQ